jgi:hypothetical protein
MLSGCSLRFTKRWCDFDSTACCRCCKLQDESAHVHRPLRARAQKSRVFLVELLCGVAVNLIQRTAAEAEQLDRHLSSSTATAESCNHLDTNSLLTQASGACFALECGVPPVLDCIVCAPWQELGNHCSTTDMKQSVSAAVPGHRLHCCDQCARPAPHLTTCCH